MTYSYCLLNAFFYQVLSPKEKAKGKDLSDNFPPAWSTAKLRLEGPCLSEERPPSPLPESTYKPHQRQVSPCCRSGVFIGHLVPTVPTSSPRLPLKVWDRNWSWKSCLVYMKGKGTMLLSPAIVSNAFSKGQIVLVIKKEVFIKIVMQLPRGWLCRHGSWMSGESTRAQWVPPFPWFTYVFIHAFVSLTFFFFFFTHIHSITPPFICLIHSVRTC